jgi:hypothetical protein
MSSMEMHDAVRIVKAACDARRAVRESLSAREAASETILFRCQEWGTLKLEKGAFTETQWLFHVMRPDEDDDGYCEWVVRYCGDGDLWEAAPEYCCTRSEQLGDSFEFRKGSSIRLTVDKRQESSNGS